MESTYGSNTPATRWLVAILLGSGLLTGLYMIFMPGMNATIAETGQQMHTVTLDDGTRITLRPHSRLTASDEPNVYELTGEAYFQVTGVRTEPLHIQGEGARITASATSFTFSTWPDRPEVFLQSGQITFSDRATGRNRQLQPGQLASLRSDGEIIVNHEAHYQETRLDWLHDTLVAESHRIERVTAELSHHFHIDLDLAGIDPDRSVTAHLYLDDKRSALQELAAILEAELQQTEAGNFVLNAD